MSSSSTERSDGTYGVSVANRVGDVEDESKHDDGDEGEVELKEADEEEEDPRDGELQRVPRSALTPSAKERTTHGVHGNPKHL